MFKDFPLNFDVTTWRLSQWISTITFFIVICITLTQNFGYLGEYAVNVFTPIGFVSFIALIVEQAYTYGGYISNTISDILIPAGIIVLCFIIELCFSYVLSNIGYIPKWSSYFLKYCIYLLQSLIMIWVYKDVQFIEIPKDELKSVININSNHRKIEFNKNRR